MADINRLENFVALDSQFKRIEDVRVERWTKQIFNGAWNPITAIFGLETHQLLASPYLHLVKQLANETYNLAIHMGITLPEDLPDKTIELARTNPSLAPSMLQDARKKKLMEVDSLCGQCYPIISQKNLQVTVILGSIIRQAEQVGVQVPTVRMAYHTLMEMNRQMKDSTFFP
jgi:ketopantoate reductase